LTRGTLLHSSALTAVYRAESTSTDVFAEVICGGDIVHAIRRTSSDGCVFPFFAAQRTVVATLTR
jgi:hypothetical protein